MILMASIICIFASRLLYFEFFCIFTHFLWLSLTNEMSYQLRNDFLLNLSSFVSLKINGLETLEITGFEKR